jgi:N-acetylmuramoyl-L-alanine amidase
MTGSAPEFVSAVRVDGSTLTVDLGPAASSVRTDDTDPAHLALEFSTNAPVAPAPPASPPAGRSTTAPQEMPPLADIAAGAGLRIVAIDPGHGGDDAGAHGAGGAVEKDLALQVARRLKAAIESRIGVRVLLTREGDEAVPIDRRTALANNNKADLLISLHANASFQRSARGAQVLSLGLEDYKDRARGLPVSLPVPVVGGGTRLIDAMPWDLAQIPHASQSAALAGFIVRHLTEHNVKLYARSNDQAPLRVLVGANMPAVLVEMGFLSNTDDERALTSGDVPGAIVESLIASIVDARNGLRASAGGGR